MKARAIIIVFLFSTFLFSQEQKFVEKELSIPSTKVVVNGALLAPLEDKKTSLVIIIPGSGTNDRDGNQVGSKGNSLKYLAEGLASNQIATYRYDKSAIALLKKKDFKEEDIVFDDFIDDAIAVIDYFKDQERYSKIIVVGHSQGSLVGMVASKSRADAFISLAGAGRPINEILQEQLSLQAPSLKEDITKTLDSLKKGKIDKDYNKLLASIFRESVQPFLISWIKYNPQEEIKKLNIPILIVNGTKDLQVQVSDAELLYKANAKCQFKFIKNMNHVFKEIKGDRTENIAAYNNTDLPTMQELITVITKFVNSI